MDGAGRAGLIPRKEFRREIAAFHGRLHSPFTGKAAQSQAVQIKEGDRGVSPLLLKGNNPTLIPFRHPVVERFFVILQKRLQNVKGGPDFRQIILETLGQGVIRFSQVLEKNSRPDPSVLLEAAREMQSVPD